MSSSGLPDRLRSRRLKIAVACDSCRASKKKCDGTRPACKQCQKKRGPCSYRNLTIASSNIRPDGHVSLPSQSSSPDTERPESDETKSAELPSGAVHGVFAGEVRAAIDAKLGILSSKKVINLTPFTDAPLFELCLSLQVGENVDNVLPPRRHADHLVDMFWRHIQPLEPMLERECFSRSYEALFAGRSLHRTDERTFLSTLNMVFALSTQLQERLPAEERNRASTTYFRRAWALLRVDAVLWEPGSLELVQCLLLMARYLQCSNNPHQTWMAIGIAVRMAQGIGLDKPNFSPDESPYGGRRGFQERLWQCCVYMDRSISWVAGRTPVVFLPGLSAGAHPLHQAAEESCQDGEQTTNYLTKTLELYDISNYISLSHFPTRSSFLDKLGLPSLYRFDEHFSNVPRFDACLDRWVNGLPLPLRYGHVDSRVDLMSYGQSLLLQLRLLHARVALFRPMLARCCLLRVPSASPNDLPDRGGLGARVVQDCAALCVETAQKMIAVADECSVVSDIAGVGVGIVPWWYRVFYLHVGSTVLMAATLQRTLCTSAVSESWGRAMSALRAHEHLSPFVSQCLATFETLSSGMAAHLHPQPCAPSTAVEGASNVKVAIPLQDVLFQDVVFDADAFLFGMENMSWVDSFGPAS